MMKYWKTKYQVAQDLSIRIEPWFYGDIKTDLIEIVDLHVCGGYPDNQEILVL